MSSSSSKAFQWLSLVGIIWLQSINGTNTTFPAYSSQLKNTLFLSQLQINNLVFASDAGKLFGWFSGIAAIYLPLWLVLIIGSLLGLIGYGVQFLFVTNQISSPAYWQIFLLTMVAGNSVCWINTVCYVVCIRNFPFHQQVAVGLTTSYQGLSAKIYTDIVGAAFSSSPHKRAKAYLLLNSLLPLLVSVVVAPFVRDIDVGRGEPRNMAAGFKLMFVVTIATGIYAVITSLGSMSSIHLSPLQGVIGTVLFLLIPLVIPIVEKIGEKLSRRWSLDRENRVHDFSIEDQKGLESIESGVVKEEEEEEHSTVQVHNEVGEVQVHHGIGVREEIGVKLMVKRIDFWLYFLVYIFSATIGLVFLNTLGQIAESRGSSKTSSLVSLSSSFGFFGRLMTSLLDYFFSRSKYMISRPAFLVTLAAPIAGVFFLLLNPANVSLIISTAIIGVCTGAITSIAVSITTELFGTKNFSINHNVVVVNISIGSFLFGYSSALIYRKEGNEDGSCLGMACYRSSFIIWGSLCMLGTTLAFVLYARTRKFYSKIS
ncbi:putative major facilitator superfamily domain-containing protein [Rosa chinensis]|uniref:Putative major facilitator superfamily domain-containing protein n=1 Tax=Rosa chinensis TaxID=74649 RepID=A0A2P6PQH3_ROSCH|nr:protein NUCLEAR FUSION DEFECTIVE 4 [Rosa chinensis]PRQ24162.1 putative major facilitator superfamily domain-containing protein [Rosa chinensis]